MKKSTLSVLNIIFLIVTIWVNFLANGLPIGGNTTGELADMYPNLFVPAWLTFSIWGLIYLLLLWFVIWQFIDAKRDNSLGVTEQVGPWFILSCCANIAWIFARHYTFTWLSVVIMLLLLGTLIVLSNKVRTWQSRGTWKNKLFTQIPFGVYLGWISVATIANITSYLVDTWRDMWWFSDIFWTITVIWVATVLGILALAKDANIPFVWVLLWAFLGIALKRVDVDPVYATPILWMLVVCSVVLSIGVWARWRRWWSR